MTLTPPLLVLAAGGKPRLRRERLPVPKEIILHVTVADLLREHCLWDWTHINRKAKDAREGKILKTMGVNPGWPDFILLSPSGHALFLELKRPGQELTEEQEQFRDRCIRRGNPCEIAWTLDQVLVALQRWGCLRVKFPAPRTDG
jgi:hypothetical protein